METKSFAVGAALLVWLIALQLLYLFYFGSTYLGITNVTHSKWLPGPQAESACFWQQNSRFLRALGTLLRWECRQQCRDCSVGRSQGNGIPVLKSSHKISVKYLILLYLFPGISCCVPFWLITEKEHKEIMPITSWLLPEKFLWSWKRKIAAKPNSTLGWVHWLYQPAESGRKGWEEAERRGEEGLLMVERATWSLEKPDPGMFAGDEKRESLFSLAFAQWVAPQILCLNAKWRIVAWRKAALFYWSLSPL